MYPHGLRYVLNRSSDMRQIQNASWFVAQFCIHPSQTQTVLMNEKPLPTAMALLRGFEVDRLSHYRPPEMALYTPPLTNSP